MRDSPVFAYQQIAGKLADEIARGAFAGGRLPSERELSARFGVNRLTLRKSLDILTGQGRITRMGARGTFVRSAAAKANSLAGKVVAFVLVGRTGFDEYHSRTITHLEREARQMRANTMLFCLEGGKVALLAKAAQRGIIHAIVMSGLISPAVLKRIKALGLPTVMLGNMQFTSPAEHDVDRVLVDAVAYGEAATRHLLQLGHERIAFINGPPYTWFIHAEQGYAKALLEAGQVRWERLVERCADDSLEQGTLAMRRLLAGARPTAVFAANDRLACGALRELASRKITVPASVSVVGVGNHLRGQEEDPPLTSIAIATPELARTALNLLRERIDTQSGRHGSMAAGRSVYVPFKLLKRGTCAKPGKRRRSANARKSA